MPSINIREIDRTGAETQAVLNYTVLVPGLKLTTAASTASGEPVIFGGLITDVSQFAQDFVDAPADYEKDIGFVSAYQYVLNGLSVYYVPAYESIPAIIGAAQNPTSLLDSKTVAKFFEEFEDKGKYDVRFITLGGIAVFPDADLVDAETAAIKCAGNRGDAVALVDVPLQASGKNFKSATEVNAWVQTNFKEVAKTRIPKAQRHGISWEKDKPTETYGRYGAMFAPVAYSSIETVKYKEPVESGEEGEVSYPVIDMVMPASFFAITSFGKQVTHFPDWFATAGSVRGVAPFDKILPVLDFGDADTAIFQRRSGDANDGHVATNIIRDIRPYGNIIWGNRTMHPLGKPDNLPNGEVQLQASSFLNIRELCITLKKEIYRAARKFTFDPNTDVLWYNFRTAITPLLERMKTSQGIRGYQIIQIPTKKKALLIARIVISPIEAVEDYDISLELTDSVAIAE